MGGYDEDNYAVSSIYMYDHIAKEWSEKPHMIQPRIPSGCGVVQNSERGPEIVIVGNRDSDYNTQIEIFNPQESKFSIINYFFYNFKMAIFQTLYDLEAICPMRCEMEPVSNLGGALSSWSVG